MIYAGCDQTCSLAARRMRLRAAVLATAAAAAADTLAIVTEFRSGSTLLGGLVANASTFYFFEPCRLLGGDHNRKVASGSCDALVPRLLACDAALGDKVWREVATKDRGFLGHRVGATKPAAVVTACAARERVAKVTRMDAGLPKAFLDAVDRTLRLVRDPRAVVNSRIRGRMCSNKKISACARTVCKRMTAKDADEERLGLLSRGDYRVVYYERLVTKTAAELDGISRWRGRGKLGVPERHHALRQVNDKSDAECKPGRSCRRDGAAVAARWREELSPADVATIEADERCARTMRRHNYTVLYLAS